MNWQDWTLTGLFVLNALISIVMIEKPREPLTPWGAAIGLVVNAGLIWLVITG